MSLSSEVPGTSIQRAGPALLDEALSTPARTPEQARRQARALLSRAAEAVAAAEGAVSRLGVSPPSFASTLSYLRGRNLEALGAASSLDAFAALEDVRRRTDEIIQLADALRAAAGGRP